MVLARLRRAHSMGASREDSVTTYSEAADTIAALLARVAERGSWIAEARELCRGSGEVPRRVALIDAALRGDRYRGGVEMSMSDYYAAKDAERPDGSVDWSQVPIRNGGTLDTGHPEDTDD